MDVWHFSLAFLGQRHQRWKFWFLLAFLFKSTSGGGFGFYWHFCPSLPTVEVLGFIGIFNQVYQRWKFWSFWPRFLSLATLAMNGNRESYVIWSLPLSNLWNPVSLHASSRSPEAIFGTLMWKPEFVLQGEIVGMELEILTDTFTGRKSVKRLHAICCKAHLSVNIVWKIMFWTRSVQARNQLGTPEGWLWEGPNFLKLYPIV